MRLFIIGAGGVGSWLCPSLCLLAGKDSVMLIDGDKLESGNLNRQLFNESELGQNKAAALAARYGCSHSAEWFNFGLFEHAPSDWLIVCVDNDVARVAALNTCDRYECPAIIAANETTSAEAVLYLPQWRDTKRDPRVNDPAMLTNGNGDPQRRAIGCTGAAQVEKPQLVSANFMAASLAQHLFVLWALEWPKMENSAELVEHLPYKLVANLSALETHKIGKV